MLLWKYCGINMSDWKTFSPDFKEFAALLHRHKVRYLITGGYAVAVYGVSLNFIGLQDLKKNKRASGRAKDIDDLHNLP